MRLAGRVDALAVRLPAGDRLKSELRSRIGVLADECGCSLGGAFLVVAVALTVGHFLRAGGLNLGSGLLAVGFVLGASLVGKAIGLSLAQVRLLWLRRVVAARLASIEVSDVHLH